METEPNFMGLVSQIVDRLESETVRQIIEVKLDLIELLLSSLPECLIKTIEKVLVFFLKQLSKTASQFSFKANDLINLSRETLGSDFLLPHFVTILNEMPKDMKSKKMMISAIEVLNVLIDESDTLKAKDEEESYF